MVRGLPLFVGTEQEGSICQEIPEEGMLDFLLGVREEHGCSSLGCHGQGGKGSRDVTQGGTYLELKEITQLVKMSQQGGEPRTELQS